MKIKSLINYKLDCDKTNAWIDFEISKRANPDNYSNQVVSDYSMSNDDNYKQSGMILHDDWSLEQETNTYSKLQFKITYLEETGFYLSTHDQIRVVYHQGTSKETLFLGSIADVQEDTDNPNTPQKTFTYDCYGVEKNVFEMPIVKTWRNKTIRDILNEVFKIWVQDNINGFSAIDFKNSPQWDRKISKLSHEDSIERLLQVLVIDNGGLWWVQDNILHLSTKEYVEHSLFTAPKEEDIGDLRSPLVVNQNDDKYANQVKFKCKDVKGKQIADNDLGQLNKDCNYVLPYQVYSPSAENVSFRRGSDDYKYVETIDEGTTDKPSTEKQFSVSTQAGKTVISFWPKDEDCSKKNTDNSGDTGDDGKPKVTAIQLWDVSKSYTLPNYTEALAKKECGGRDVADKDKRVLKWRVEIVTPVGDATTDPSGSYYLRKVSDPLLEFNLFNYTRYYDDLTNHSTPIDEDWVKSRDLQEVCIGNDKDKNGNKKIPWDIHWNEQAGADWITDSIFETAKEDATTLNINGHDYPFQKGLDFKIKKEDDKVWSKALLLKGSGTGVPIGSQKSVENIVAWMNTAGWWDIRSKVPTKLQELQKYILDVSNDDILDKYSELVKIYDGLLTTQLPTGVATKYFTKIEDEMKKGKDVEVMGDAKIKEYVDEMQMEITKLKAILAIYTTDNLTDAQKADFVDQIEKAKDETTITNDILGNAAKKQAENLEKATKDKEAKLNSTLTYYQNINEVIVLDNIDEQSKLHAVLDAGWIVSKDITNTRITTLDDAINYCKQYLKESVKVEEEVTLELFRGDLPTPLTNWKFEPHAVSLQNLEHITGFICGYHGSNQKQGIAKGTYLRKYNSKLYLQHYRKITQSRVATPKLFEVKTSGKLDHKNIMIADKIPVSALHFQYELNEGFKSMWEDYFNRDKYKYVDDDTEESNLSETTNLSQNSMSKGFDMVANNVTIDDAKYSITDSEIEKDKLSDDFNKKAVN